MSVPHFSYSIFITFCVTYKKNSQNATTRGNTLGRRTLLFQELKYHILSDGYMIRQCMSRYDSKSIVHSGIFLDIRSVPHAYTTVGFARHYLRHIQRRGPGEKGCPLKVSAVGSPSVLCRL